MPRSSFHVFFVIAVLALPLQANTVLWLTGDEGTPGLPAASPTDSGDYSLSAAGQNGVLYSADVAGVGAAASASERSFQLDGLDDVLVVANNAVLNLSGDYTIEFFMKLVGDNTVDGLSQLVERRASGQEYTIVGDHSYDEFVTYLDGASGGGGFSSGADSLVGLNTWAHVALVYDASNTSQEAKLYLDGGFLAGRNFSTGQGTGFTMTADLLLGASALGSGRNLNGLLDEIRITDEALEPAEFLNVVPEPQAFSLLASGAMLFLGLGRRARHR